MLPQPLCTKTRQPQLVLPGVYAVQRVAQACGSFQLPAMASEIHESQRCTCTHCRFPLDTLPAGQGQRVVLPAAERDTMLGLPTTQLTTIARTDSMTQLALRDVYTFAFAHKSTVPEAVMHNDTTSATGSSPRLNAPISVSTRFTTAVVSTRTGLCVLRTRHFLHAGCCFHGGLLRFVSLRLTCGFAPQLSSENIVILHLRDPLATAG